MAVIHKNPVRKHRPVCILLDRSKSISSYNGRLMNGINRSASEAVRKMKELVLYRDMTEVLVIQFSTEPEVTAEFVPLADLSEQALTITQARGCTDTGKALLLALDMLDRRKAECKEKGEEYFQPLLFLLTDGYPDPGNPVRKEDVEPHARAVKAYEERYAQAARRIKAMEEADKLVFVAGGITVDDELRADMDKLRELTGKTERVVELDCSGNLDSLSGFFELVLKATDSRPDFSPIVNMAKNIAFGKKADEKS